MERQFDKSQTNFISRTMLTMSAGLLITFAVGIVSSYLTFLLTPAILIGAAIAELALVFYLSARISKMSVTSARVAFYVYAMLNGFTIGILFTAYGLGYASIVFLFSSAVFFSSAMVGMTAKRDLTAVGQFFTMMLIGIILLSVVQLIFRLDGLYTIINFFGLVIFCGLTAYDMQKVKMFHQRCYSLSQDDVSKYAIISALSLYLDFINIFIYLLRLFKDR